VFVLITTIKWGLPNLKSIALPVPKIMMRPQMFKMGYVNLTTPIRDGLPFKVLYLL